MKHTERIGHNITILIPCLLLLLFPKTYVQAQEYRFGAGVTYHYFIDQNDMEDVSDLAYGVHMDIDLETYTLTPEIQYFQHKEGHSELRMLPLYLKGRYHFHLPADRTWSFDPYAGGGIGLVFWEMEFADSAYGKKTADGSQFTAQLFLGCQLFITRNFCIFSEIGYRSLYLENTYYWDSSTTNNSGYDVSVDLLASSMLFQVGISFGFY